MEFATLRLNDAEIIDVTAKREELIVRYRDWQEQKRQIAFSAVAGYQWFSPEGKALSHGVVDDTDPFLRQACEAAEEDSPHDFHLYAFVSAWSDLKILKVVAKRVMVVEE